MNRRVESLPTKSENAAVRRLSVTMAGKRGGAGLFSIWQSWRDHRHFTECLHMVRGPAVAIGMLKPNLGCTSGKISATPVSNSSFLALHFICGNIIRNQWRSNCQADYRIFERFQPLLNVPFCAVKMHNCADDQPTLVSSQSKNICSASLLIGA